MPTLVKLTPAGNPALVHGFEVRMAAGENLSGPQGKALRRDLVTWLFGTAEPSLADIVNRVVIETVAEPVVVEAPVEAPVAASAAAAAKRKSKA